MTEDMMHRPTPEFRDRLERDVISAYRLDRALDEARPRSTAWMRAAAVVIASVAIGATAGLAPAQIRDSARRDSLLQAAQADASIAMLRLQLAQQEEADVKRKVDAGALDVQSLADADAQLHAAESQVMRLRYNIEEITATSQPPRDDLNSPLVKGRDFVTNRLQLEAYAAQQALTAAERAADAAERRVRVGAAGEQASLDARLELARAKAAFAVIAQRLILRKEFLQKGTPVDQLSRRLKIFQLGQDISVAEQALAVQRERLGLIEKQHAAGVADDVTFLKARVDEKMAEAELQAAGVRLKQVRAGNSE